MQKQQLLDALIFTLPLMMTDATKIKFTNTLKATHDQAPINQLFHADELVDATFTDIVTPNADTIYSQAFLDLSKDTVIFEFPKTDRFCTIQILDAYTNTIDVLDAIRFENEINKFIFTGKDFEGEIPEGMTRIVSPTNLVWILIRTICNGKDDLENVSAIQQKMDSYTLAQYKAGTTKIKAEGTYDEKNNFVPVRHVLEMPIETYFANANELMIGNPPSADDAEILEKLAELNVGPNLVFDKTALGEKIDVLWAEILNDLINYCTVNSYKYMVKNGNWMYFGKPIAEFGTAYIYRALISLAGLGANPVRIAIYPKAELDANGERLNGTNQYKIHFNAGLLPPVKENGFWSITAYDSTNDLFIDNELNRYCINDRSAVKYNEDGSLDILIQHEKPQDESLSNWLPVSKGNFHFILRIYLPQDCALKSEWHAPVIKKMS